MHADAAAYPMMYGGGVGTPEIDQAEVALGVKFDPEYVRFLREFGGAMLGAEPLLGLSRADVMGIDSWSVVDVTLRFRSEGWEGVDDWYLVSVDGAGNPVGVARDGAVYLSDHHGGGISKLANSFLDYLNSRT
jgi:hypothetical protein